MLSNTHELSKYLDSNKFKNIEPKLPSSSLLREWNSLRTLMWSQNCIIEPGRFIQHVQKVAKEKNMSIFTDFSQNDVSEFLLFIIDCFHNDIARPVKMQIHGDAVTETDTLAIKVFDRYVIRIQKNILKC